MDFPRQGPASNPDGTVDRLEAREQEALDVLADALDEPLTVQVAERQGIPVLYVEGEVDIYTAGRLMESLDRVIAARPAGVVVELSRTAYLDSKGLAVLLRATRALPGKLAVVGARERVVRLFQATGLAGALAVFRSLPEALDALTH